MAEEILASSAMAEPALAEESDAAKAETENETLAVASCEATIQLGAHAGTTDSTCNNDFETSGITSDGDGEKTLEYASELMKKGSTALKEGDFSEACDCFSRALEIRVGHYGELAFECVDAYQKYGSALLYKAQEESDPLVTVPKKEGESEQDDQSVKGAVNCESTTASVSSIAEQEGTSKLHGGAVDDGSSGKAEEGGNEESDEDDDLAEAEEDESDLDLAWKMLDIARAIVEKQPCETLVKVNILSTLAEVALEREDVETSLSDYLKALSILERLVEPDDRQLAELNFRTCLCLELSSKSQDAIPYCQKALTICKTRVERLTNEAKSLSGSEATSASSEICQAVQQSSGGSSSINPVSDKEAEIETLNGLSSELEKKLEDLQHAASNPSSMLTEILAAMSAKAMETSASAAMSSSQMGTANSNGNFDSPTISTAHTNGAAEVTDLGVVGRGVKRASTASGSAESGLAKRPSVSSSPKKGDENAS